MPMPPKAMTMILGLLAYFQSPHSRGDEAAHVTIDRALAEKSPAVMEFIVANGYRNVGILGFRVRAIDTAGAEANGLLNRSLASRLEVALVLAEKPLSPVGIVRVGAAAAPEPEGRAALFARRFPMAWGTEQVQPDVFLISEARLSDDLRGITVVIEAFDARGGPPQEVVRFTAAADAPALADAGVGFLSRGVAPNRKIKLKGDAPQNVAKTDDLSEQPAENALRVRKGRVGYPLDNPEAPVALEIRYDGNVMPVRFVGGAAYVDEPKPRQAVEFVLRRRHDDGKRYGVVLAVNGRNTLFRETLTSGRCAKWVLAPGAAPLHVRGFQTRDGKSEAFRVLADDDSKDRAKAFRGDAGKINLIVYRQRDGNPQEGGPPPIDQLAQNEALISRGLLPDRPPASFQAMAAQVRNPGPLRDRGLIVEGEAVDAPVRDFPVVFEDVPVMSASVRYYQAVR